MVTLMNIDSMGQMGISGPILMGQLESTGPVDGPNLEVGGLAENDFNRSVEPVLDLQLLHQEIETLGPSKNGESKVSVDYLGRRGKTQAWMDTANTREMASMSGKLKAFEDVTVGDQWGVIRRTSIRVNCYTRAMVFVTLRFL
ncbi:hypothetical protein CsSME_00051275 [Camellia sinensis var. sinensis]